MLERLGVPGDVLKLFMAIAMSGPLARLAIGLKSVTQLLRHIAHGLMAYRMTLMHQLSGYCARAFAGPAQR